MEYKDCGACKYSADAPENQNTIELFLVCRKAIPSANDQGRASWPLVAATDTCAQFVPDDSL